MDAFRPQTRHRGFFLHSETDETDAAEHEAPEGMTVRVRISRATSPRHVSGTTSAGRSRSPMHHPDESRPAIRSGSVTGSRQRAHLHR
jgi:hypothetical protein